MLVTAYLDFYRKGANKMIARTIRQSWARIALTAIAISVGTASAAFSQSASAEKASPAELAFIAGQWRGEMQNGITEENCSLPTGDSMMGVFRYVKNGKAVFYELLLIEATANGLVLRLKHFHPGLKGWEEKDEVYSYPLIELRKDRAVFERPDKMSRLTFHRTSAEEMSIWLDQTRDAKPSSQEFKYRLAK
jgi:hypothetical protein